MTILHYTCVFQKKLKVHLYSLTFQITVLLIQVMGIHSGLLSSQPTQVFRLLIESPVVGDEIIPGKKMALGILTAEHFRVLHEMS